MFGVLLSYLVQHRISFMALTFSQAAHAVNRSHVESAIAQIDQVGTIPQRRRSTDWSLQGDSNRLYPPKYLFELAAKLATGDTLDYTGHSGGNEANDALRTLGFTIVPYASNIPEA